MSAPRTCKKHVFTGARWDTGGHRCGLNAMKGSEFCHLHGGKPETDDRAEATASPTAESSTRVTLYAELRWERGTGPVVKLPYVGGYGFIDRVWARQEDDGPVRMSCSGTKRKANGQPGIQSWSNSFGTEKLIGEEWTEKLLASIELERSKL